MATISNNEIKIKYSLDTTDLANATALFDRLSAEDRQLLNDLKKLQAQLTATGKAGAGAGNSIAGGNKAAAGSLTDLQNRVKDLTNRLNNLNPTASNYETILKRLQRAQANLSIATAQMNDKLGKSQAQFKTLDATIGSLGNTLLAVFSVQQFLSFGKSVLDTTIKMQGLQKAIEFTAGSAIGGASDFRFLKEIAEQLGLPLQAAAEGFKGFSAAAQRANITVMQQREMFTDLSKAMAALQVTSQDAQLIFFGFSQLMSKAKVSAQELYHQIGERLPLAMEAAQIAAGRLTGQTKVTTSELMMMVESGKLLSDQFAPQFTKALGELAKGGALVETLGKDVTRLSNAWEEFKAALGDDSAINLVVKGLTKVVEKINKITEAANYYSQNGLFPDVSFQEFKKFEKQATDTYDKVASTADTRFKELIDINKSFQKTLTDDTEQAELQRVVLQTQFNEKRKQVVQDLINNVKREEANIKKAQDEIAKTTYGFGPSTNKDKVIQLKQDIKVAEAAKAAFEKLYADIPELATFLPDPEKEKKKDKELENLYKTLIDREESRMKAEEDLIKSRTRPGTEQDLLVVQNRIKFNNKMLDIDRDARFKELELAKNNAVKRDAEIVKDEESIEETKRQIRFKAFAAEKEYLDKNLELIQDAQRKRKQAIQTDEQNELEDTKDFYDDKEKVLTDAYKKNIAVQGLSNETLKTLEQNYNDAILELTEDREKARLDIIDKYRAIEKRQRIEAEAEIRSTLVEAATIRNAALEKNEMRKADIADEGALAQIEIERKKNHDIAAEELKSGNLSEENKKIINEKLHSMDVLLDAQATAIIESGEQRRREYRAQIAIETVNALKGISDGLFNHYQQQLDNELVLLNRNYDEQIRLADGNQAAIANLEAKRREQEREIKLKQFRAEQQQAIANVIFNTAPIIAQYLAGVLTAPLAAIGIASQAAQIGLILAQPVPEFAEGTKGKKFKGGPAIVGERGVEKVITESGKVYYTPNKASLVELPKGSQVIPNHALTKPELFLAGQYAGRTTTTTASPVVGKLDEIGGILKGLPITQLNMDERGFEKFIRTPRRTTKILNNRFGIKS